MALHSPVSNSVKLLLFGAVCAVAVGLMIIGVLIGRWLF